MARSLKASRLNRYSLTAMAQLNRFGSTAATFAAGLADAVTSSALEFRPYFDEPAATDWATGNIGQIRADRFADKPSIRPRNSLVTSWTRRNRLCRWGVLMGHTLMLIPSNRFLVDLL